MGNAIVVQARSKHRGGTGTVAKVRCGTSILALPLDLLAEVLQHLDQRDRLICCALVSKSWHQAANIATSWVEIDLEAAAGQGLAQTGSLSAWLRSNKYASNIRYIRVWQKPTDAPSISVLQVCCQQLKGLEELELAFCQLKTVTASVQSYAPPSLGVTSAEQTTAACAPQAEVAAGFESPARESRNLGALTALTSLDLLQTCLDLDELSSCTGLQYLALFDVTHGSTPPTTEFDPAAAESKVQPAVSPTTVIPPQIAFALSRLTQLRHLHIGYTFKMEEEQQQQQEASAVYASFGSLPNLQNLWLGVDTTEVEDLSQIPVCLTTLRISGISLALTVDTMPKLPLMTTLEELHIVGIPSFDALLLASLTRLTWLCMCIVDAPVDADGLLTSLQQLKHMRLLKLHGCLEEDCTDMEKYAALTVSSQLEELHLPTCQIPPEAFEYVFAHSMIRKMLTSIVVSSDFLGSAGNCERLVACSPALREFGIADSPGIPGWASLIDVQGLSAFSRLTALTRISITDVALNDEALEGIAACTQLQDLILHNKKDPDTEVSVAGLMHLTRLTVLERLVVRVVIIDRIYRLRMVAQGCTLPLHLRLQQAITQLEVQINLQDAVEMHSTNSWIC